MKISGLFLRSMMVLQFTFSHVPAAAADAPGRAQIDRKSHGKLERLRTTTFEYLANQFMMVKTAEEYETWLLTSLNAEDRKEASQAFRNVKKIERVRRVMDTLLFQADGKTIKITWPDVRKPHFTMSGVTFAYDAKKPLKTQIEAWANRASAKSKNALLRQIWPEAEAAAVLPVLYWVGTVVGAAIVGAATSETFKNARCWATQGSSFDGEDCINMRKARLEARQTGMPTFDAVKNMSGSDNSNVLSKFEGPKWDRQCPSNNDGKDRFLITQVRTVRIDDGVKQPTSDWLYVWVKLSAAGDPQDMLLTSSPDALKPEDVQTRDGAKKLIAHIVFDPTTNRPVSFRIPNPESAKVTGPAGILHSPTLNLSLTMELTPQQRDIIANAADIVKWAIFRTYNCVVQEVVAEQQAGIQSGSPTQPKPDPAKSESTTTK